jgi:hypothetical protein
VSGDNGFMMFRQAPYGPSAARTKIVLGTAQHGLAKFSAPETGRWNIDRLVRLLARAEPELGLTAEIRAALVAKLRPIIESFDRLHV